MGVHFEKNRRVGGAAQRVPASASAEMAADRVVSAQRTFVLGADDYGIAPGIDRAIEHLIELRHVTATSAMVTLPCWKRDAPDFAALVHVHPGRGDAALRAVDTLTTPREWEYEYLAGEAFVTDCARLGVWPALPSGTACRAGPKKTRSSVRPEASG